MPCMWRYGGIVDAVTKKWIRSKADELAVEKGCYFDEAAGQHCVTFFEKHLRHTTGKWAGKPLKLLDWQRDEIVMPLFGWMNAEGFRRYRLAYIEVAKKNGKSTMCAGLALYLLTADGEEGAQVYCAAADRQQAGIVYRDASKMGRGSPLLHAHLKCTDSVKNIAYPGTGSFLRVISRDHYSAEGLNVHGLVFDELHAQKTRELWDTLRYGGAAREQPLIISITTAGWDRHSICWEQHEYAEKVLEGVVEDEAFFAYIRSAEADADWTDPATWAAANPSLGVTIDEGEMEQACIEAQSSPTKENAFKRYRLNIWTEQLERWLPMEAWDACFEGEDAPEPEGLCYGALDLSSTQDVTAFGLYWPETNQFRVWFWIPGDNAHERELRDRVPYETWAKQGYITTTEGNVVDYRFVRSAVVTLAEEYRPVEIGYDPWNARQIALAMQDEDELPMIEFRQGYQSMNEPCKRLEALVMAGDLRHDGNPVLRWMVSNVTVRQDPAGNIKIDKARSAEKVDGVVVLAMAIGCGLAGNVETESIYETRGLVFV